MLISRNQIRPDSPSAVQSSARFTALDRWFVHPPAPALHAAAPARVVGAKGNGRDCVALACAQPPKPPALSPSARTSAGTGIGYAKGVGRPHSGAQALARGHGTRLGRTRSARAARPCGAGAGCDRCRAVAQCCREVCARIPLRVPRGETVALSARNVRRVRAPHRD